jgi:uridine phosphorylase
MSNTKQPLKPSDLLLNEDGSIYHLKIKPGELANTVLIVGDPARAEEIAGFFEDIEYSNSNREFTSFTGTFKSKRFTALSTGIGTDNIDIVVNELDALANIDFTSRTINDKHKTLQIVRLGTSGSMHPHVPAGTMVLASHGLGIDGTMQYYANLDEVTDKELTEQFISSLSWPGFLPRPYIITGHNELIRKLDRGPFKGITVTAPGFYASQGREIRLPGSFPGMLEKIAAFEHQGHMVVNFEMETAALYGLCALLGHQAASICVILANRALGTYDPRYKESVKDMITFVLNKLAE